MIDHHCMIKRNNKQLIFDRYSPEYTTKKIFHSWYISVFTSQPLWSKHHWDCCINKAQLVSIKLTYMCYIQATYYTCKPKLLPAVLYNNVHCIAIQQCIPTYIKVKLQYRSDARYNANAFWTHFTRVQRCGWTRLSLATNVFIARSERVYR